MLKRPKLTVEGAAELQEVEAWMNDRVSRDAMDLLFDELNADSLCLVRKKSAAGVPKWGFKGTAWGGVLCPEIVATRTYEDYVNMRKAICHMVDKMAEEEEAEGVAKIEVPLIPAQGANSCLEPQQICANLCIPALPS